MKSKETPINSIHPESSVLDTVVLTLSDPEFEITDPKVFGPASPIPGGGEKRSQNATKQEKRRNVTKPALTWSRRFSGGPSESLRIEFSVPKFLFRSNLAEVIEADLAGVTAKLSGVLDEMGVAASSAALVAGRLSKIHFSKNVPLPVGTTASAVLWTLRRSLTSGKKDQLDTNWKNGGEGFRLHTTWRELLVYDKIADVKKAKWSPTRAIDPLSWGLPSEEVSGFPAGTHVVRLEARFNSPRAIRAAFLRVGIPNEQPRFLDVFSEAVAKAILLDELSQFHGSSLATDPDATPEGMLHDLLADGVKPSHALKVMAVAMLERSVTPLGLRKLLRDHGVKDSFWYGLGEFRRTTPSGAGGTELVELLRKAVDEFRPIRLGPS